MRTMLCIALITASATQAVTFSFTVPGAVSASDIDRLPVGPFAFTGSLDWIAADGVTPLGPIPARGTVSFSQFGTGAFGLGAFALRLPGLDQIGPTFTFTDGRLVDIDFSQTYGNDGDIAAVYNSNFRVDLLDVNIGGDLQRFTATGTLDFSKATFAGVPVVAGVPEAATWMLAIAGFGVLGGALRQRRERGIAFAD